MEKLGGGGVVGVGMGVLGREIVVERVIMLRLCGGFGGSNLACEELCS